MIKPDIQYVSINDIQPLNFLEEILPPIDEIADQRLKAEISAVGIREPLVLAIHEGRTVILDGHNRHRIAKELQYTTVPAVFRTITDLLDAEKFVLDNQLGKRNLSDKERILIVLKLEPELAAEAAARKNSPQTEEGQIFVPPTGKVINQLAKLAGKSRETIRKVKAIQQTGNARLLQIAGEDISIDKAFDIAGMPSETWEAAIGDELTKNNKREKPGNNRHFTCQYITVDNDQCIVDIRTEFIKLSNDGQQGIIKLDPADELKSLEHIKAVADHYANLAKNLRQAAQNYRTAKSDKVKVKKSKSKKVIAVDNPAKPTSVDIDVDKGEEKDVGQEKTATGDQQQQADRLIIRHSLLGDLSENEKLTAGVEAKAAVASTLPIVNTQVVEEASTVNDLDECNLLQLVQKIKKMAPAK